MGSFLNVCISRLPRHESIVKPRSRCPECGATIRWYDNVPLLSWILLRARCRDCKAKISWRYPLVELAMGIWFVGIATNILYAPFTAFYAKPRITLTTNWWINFSIEQVGIAILGFLLIGLIVMDWQTHLLPDAFTLTGIAIGIFLVCAQAIFLAPHEGDVVLDTTHQLRISSPGSNGIHGNIFLTGTEALIFGRIAAILGAAAATATHPLALQALRHREGMGLGDVKLLAMIAAFLGFWPRFSLSSSECSSLLRYALVLLIRRPCPCASPVSPSAAFSLSEASSPHCSENA